MNEFYSVILDFEQQEKERLFREYLKNRANKKTKKERKQENVKQTR